jgi:hypothetical protein
MKGTLNIVLAAVKIGAEEVHVAVIPVVVQAHPLLLAGKIPNNVPTGICAVTVINPLEGAVPMFVTVTGIKLVVAATGKGEG